MSDWKYILGGLWLKNYENISIRVYKKYIFFYDLTKEKTVKTIPPFESYEKAKEKVDKLIKNKKIKNVIKEL